MDLLELGWILQGSGGVLRGRFNSMLHERGLSRPKNVVETSALPVAIALLQITNMVAVLPEQAVLPYCAAGLVRPRRQSWLPLPAGLARQRRGRR